MYAWIWRKLPFGLYGKLTGSLVLAGGAAVLLWFVVFPWLDPFIEQTLVPWNEGQLQGDFDSDPGGDPGLGGSPGTGTDGATVGPDGQVLENEHDLPYETE